MGSYADIINKCKRSWNCSSLMDSAHAERGEKLPFSSPLLNYSTYGGIPRGQITEFFGNPGGGKAGNRENRILPGTQAKGGRSRGQTGHPSGFRTGNRHRQTQGP